MTNGVKMDIIAKTGPYNVDGRRSAEEIVVPPHNSDLT